MRVKHCLLSLAIASALITSPAFADKKPRDGSADPRVKTLTYHENDVYSVKGHYGFSTAIEFSPRERVETISIGDSEAWQIVKPGRPNILFIKPLEENAETNMTVLTTKRVYTFELSAGKPASRKSGDLTFHLRFEYPDQASMELANIGDMSPASLDPLADSDPSGFNFDYSYSGSKRLRPVRAFDDGTFTYLQFNDFEATPAVFAVDERGNESLVNFTVQGKYLVISNIGAQFTLRDGDTATCIFNDAYPRNTAEETTVVPIQDAQDKRADMEKEPLAADDNTGFFDRMAEYVHPVKNSVLND